MTAVHVLALDPRATPGELDERLAPVRAALRPQDAVTVVGPLGADGYGHRPVAVGLPDRRLLPGPLGPIAQLVRANLDSRAAWRALRADAAALAELRAADLVVVVDTLGQRSGWMLARRHGVRALAGHRALRYALRAHS